jgi:hypothetical protein
MAEYPEINQDTLQVTWSVSVGSEGISDDLEINIREPQLQAIIYSKSNDWEYEQEWRVLVPEGAKPGPIRGPSGKSSSVSAASRSHAAE